MFWIEELDAVKKSPGGLFEYLLLSQPGLNQRRRSRTSLKEGATDF